MQAFALSQKRQIVACQTCAKVAQGEVGIKGKSSLNLGHRFFKPTEVCQGSGEK